MKLKTTAMAFVLAALPTMGFAECNWGKASETTVSTCSDGMVYDATTGICVTQATS